VGGRVLIIEDTPHNLQLMTYLLQAHGHSVVGAETAEDGLELARRDRPDLVVMDLQLTGIDGYQALQRFRRDPTLATVPVVAVTALAMVGDREQVMAAGFDGYMTKPIDPEIFASGMDDHLPAGLRGRTPAPSESGEPTLTPPTDDLRSRDRAKILAVDDLPTNLTLLRSILEPSGFRVIAASDIDTAIRAARAELPDLVLCDVHIGAESGTELLTRLRAEPALAPVRFAFLTATADPLDPVFQRERAHVIRRPLEPEQLLAEVEALIETSPKS
jgi:two-component system cell cycle response regulator